MDKDTEWNDLLRAHGLLPSNVEEQQVYAPTELIYAPLLRTVRSLSPSSNSSIDSSDPVVEAYTQRRLRELQANARRTAFGSVCRIRRDEWTAQVTVASQKAPVLVHLHKETRIASQRLAERLISLAAMYPHVKIVQIEGDEAIEHFPDENVPALLVYYEGALIMQRTGCAARNVSTEGLMQWFEEVDALGCHGSKVENVTFD